MVQGKHLNVEMNFHANTQQAQQSIQQLQNTLSQISNMPIGANIDLAKFKQATAAAQELQIHLKNAYNASTGNIDLSLLNKSLSTTNSNLATLGNSLLSAGDTGKQAFIQLAQSVSKADAPLLKTNGLLTEMWTTLKNTARWSISQSVLRGFTGAISTAYNYAKDLNESLTNIRIVTGQSTEQMAKFAEQANRAAKSLSTTTTAYTDAALIYYQQGLSDQEVQARTNVTMKMANTQGKSAEEVSDQLTSIWNNFAKGSENLEYYADAIQKLGATTASSSDEIIQGVQKFASVTSTIGLSFEYATAALATITATTRESADVVGTALKTLFSRIEGLKQGGTLDDGTDLNKYSTALANVGVNIKDATGDLKNMDTILDETASKWDNLSNAQKMALAQTVAGVRQYTQFITLMNNWDFFKENVATAKGASGYLEEQQKIYEESWEAAAKQVKASLEGIYQDLLDDEFFINFNKGLATTISGIDNFIEKFGGLGSIITTVGSLLLMNLSNKIPGALDNLRYNFTLTFKGAAAATAQINNQFKDMVNGALTGNNAIQGLTASEQQQLKNTLELQHVKESYYKVQKNMTESEKVNAEIAIAGLQKQQEEVVKLKQEQEKLNQSLEQYKINNDSIVATRINSISHTLMNKLDNQGLYGQSEIVMNETNKALELNNQTAQRLTETYIKLRQEKGEALKSDSTFALKAKDIFGPEIKSVKQFSKSIKDFSDESEMIQKTGMSMKTLAGVVREYATSASQGSSNSEKISNALANLDNVAKDESKTFQDFKDALQDVITQMGTGGIKGKELEEALRRITGPKDLNNIIDLFKRLGMTTEEAEAKAKQLQSTLNGMSFTHTATSLETIIKIAGSLGSLAMGINSFKSAYDALTDPNTEGWEKWSSVIISTSMGLNMMGGVIKGNLLPNLVALIVGVKAETYEEEKGVKAKLAKILMTKAEALETTHAKQATLLHAAAQALLNGEIGTALVYLSPYILALVALVGAILLIVSAYNKWKESTPEGQIKKLNEELEQQKTLVDEAKTSWDNLKSTIDKYEDSRKKIEELTEGTEEFKEAIQEANEAAYELIDTYKLKNFYIDKNGLIHLDKNEVAQAEKSAEQTYNSRLAQEYQLKNAVIEQQNRKIFEDNIANNQTIWTDTRLHRRHTYNNYSSDQQNTKAYNELTKILDKNFNGSIEGLTTALEQIKAEDISSIPDELKPFFEALGVDLDNSSEQTKKQISTILQQKDAIITNVSTLAENNALIDANNRLLGSFLSAGLDKAPLSQQAAEAAGMDAYNKNLKELEDKYTEEIKSIDELKKVLEEEKKYTLQGTDDNGNSIYQDNEGRRITVIDDNLDGSIANLSSIEAQPSFNESYYNNLLQQSDFMKQFPELANGIQDLIEGNIAELNEELLKELQHLNEDDYKVNLEELTGHSNYDIIKKAQSISVEDIQQAKIQRQKAEAEATYDRAAKETGWDVDVIKAYAEVLKETYPLLKNNEAAAAAAAEQNLNFAKAAQDLTQILEDNADVLAKADENSIDYLTAIRNINNALEQMFHTSFDTKYIQENLNGIKKAIQGDEKEIIKLEKQAIANITDNLDLPIEENEKFKSSLLEIYDEIGNLEIGEHLSQDMLRVFNEIIADAGWTRDQVEAILDNMHLEGEFVLNAENPDYTVVQQPMENETTTKTHIGGVIRSIARNDDGSAAGVGSFVEIDGDVTSTTASDSEIQYPQLTDAVKTSSPKTYRKAAASNPAPSKSSGGGSSKSPKEENKKDPKKATEEIERYHMITRTLERLTRALEKVSKAKDRAFGKERLRLIDEEIKATDKLIDKQKTYLYQIEGHLKEDRAALSQYGFTFDEYGEITNYIDVYQQQISKFNSQLTDEAEEEYNKFKEATAQYEETLTLLDEQQMQLQDYINSLVDLRLEKITTEVEVKIRVNDVELKLLEYYLKKIEHYQKSVSEKIDILGQKMEQVMAKAQPIQEAIDKIYMEARQYGYGLTEAETNEIQSMITAAEAAGRELTQIEKDRINAIYAIADAEDRMLNQAQEDQIQEYKEQLLELNETMWEIQDTIKEALLETIDDLNGKIQDNIARFGQYESMFSHLKNVLELTGKANTKVGLNALNKLSASTVANATEALKANVDNYNTFLKMQEQVQAQLQIAEQNNDEEMIKYWKEQLNEITKMVEESHNSMLESFTEALQAAADLFDTKINTMIAKLKKNLGDLDTIIDLYDRAKELEELYLTSNQSIYELSKLARSIGKDIDSTTNLVAKNKLKELLEDINKLRATGVKLSQYDLEYWQAKYEVEKAEIALQEAQHAKSSVSLIRNSEGVWGYVYTADQEEIDNALQNYEDKLFELKEKNQSYIQEYSESLLLNRQAMLEALAKIDKAREDYDEEVERIRTQYLEKEEFYINELIKAYDRSGIKYKETILGMVSDDETLLDSHQRFTDETIRMIEHELIPAHEEWIDTINNICLEAQFSADDLTQAVLDNVNDISIASTELTKQIIQDQQDMQAEISKTITAISDFAEEYNKQVQELESTNEDYYSKKITDYDNVMDKKTDDVEKISDKITNNTTTAKPTPVYESNPYTGAPVPSEKELEKMREQANKDKIKKEYEEKYNNAKTDSERQRIEQQYEKELAKLDTGGYTGEWGPEGKIATLHEKELVLNKTDTANILSAVDVIRNLTDRLNIQTLWSKLAKPLNQIAIAATPNHDLDQNVTIEASFPSVVDHNEIELALNNLVNTASQYASRY